MFSRWISISRSVRMMKSSNVSPSLRKSSIGVAFVAWESKRKRADRHSGATVIADRG